MSLHQDLRYGVRTMARAPVSTAVAVLCLAFGIGAATSAFTLVNSLMLRPLPVRDPGAARRAAAWRDPGEPRMNVLLVEVL